MITNDNRRKSYYGKPAIKYWLKTMQVILNKKEKEELVVKLHQENKTMRQIAEIVHMSFKDIGAIIRRIDGRAK